MKKRTAVVSLTIASATTALTMVAANLLATNVLATRGESLRQLEIRRENLLVQNDALHEILVREQSLAVIASRAQALHMKEAPDILPLVSSEKMALRQ